VLTEILVPFPPDMQTKLTLVTEIRDNIEIVHTSEYQNFLKHCFKVLQTGLLQLTQPQVGARGQSVRQAQAS
jgi:hypothetical protein